MKYIDAEKLIALIDFKLEELGMSGSVWVGRSVLQDLKNDIITSLQQELPDFPTTDEQIKEFLAAHPKIEVPEKYKNSDWLFKEQEQPEADLEKEILDWIGDEGSCKNGKWTWYECNKMLRHFYKLGLNARKEE